MDNREQWGGYGNQPSQGYEYGSPPNQDSFSRPGGLNQDYYQGQNSQSGYQGGPQSYSGSDGQSMNYNSFNSSGNNPPSAYPPPNPGDQSAAYGGYGSGTKSNTDREITDSFDDGDGQQQDELQQDLSSDGFVGNFSLSSEQVTLEEDYTLRALCRNPDGDVNESRLSLNDCLTNDCGQLRWARGGNFGDSAQDVRLEDEGKTLVATLGDGEGGWTENSIQLDERITNDNGQLLFLD
ncbi:CNVH-domain-containing protein [Myriangium duriaei CBS 260.36]|uniref:CNVH-domain-containing protein n=1 Tax=Myriangium duriaei CBS 260.36 TaxID=1168546 RepID=A0A9P4JAS1_9PEZI|nr:CNVH-domain-containing protein [Myriangium duriaei CBS 260.36]